MSPKTKSNPKHNNGANLGFEEKLWQAADKMRGHEALAPESGIAGAAA